MFSTIITIVSKMARVDPPTGDYQTLNRLSVHRVIEESA